MNFHKQISHETIPGIPNIFKSLSLHLLASTVILSGCAQVHMSIEDPSQAAVEQDDDISDRRQVQREIAKLALASGDAMYTSYPCMSNTEQRLETSDTYSYHGNRFTDGIRFVLGDTIDRGWAVSSYHFDASDGTNDIVACVNVNDPEAGIMTYLVPEAASLTSFTVIDCSELSHRETELLNVQMMVADQNRCSGVVTSE